MPDIILVAYLKTYVDIDNTLKVIILLGKLNVHKAKIMSIIPSFKLFCK